MRSRENATRSRASWSVCESTTINPAAIAAHDAERVIGQPIEREYSLTELLRRPGVTYGSLMTLPAAGDPVADAEVAAQVEVAIKYAGYIDRQREEIARGRTHESLALPAALDYRTVRGLSSEVQHKLDLHKPETIGQAARISGVTPAAISLLLVHLKRGLARSAGTEGGLVSGVKPGPEGRVRERGWRPTLERADADRAEEAARVRERE